MTARAEEPRPTELVVPSELTGAARAQFCDAIRRFATDLWAETQRIEAGLNTAGGPSEFTAFMVREADHRVGNPLAIVPARRRSGWDFVAYLASVVAGIAAGVSGNSLVDGDAWAWAVFTPSVLIIVFAAILLYPRGA